MAGDDLTKGRTIKLRLPDIRFERRSVKSGSEEEESKPESRALGTTVRISHGPQRTVLTEK